MILFTSDQLVLLFSDENGPYFAYWILLMVGVSLEHLMILFKYMLAALIPDVPDFITEMENRKAAKLDLINEQFKLNKVKKTVKDPMTSDYLVKSVTGVNL